MKKTIISLLATSALFVSCSGELEQYPSDKRAENQAITSVALLETAVRGVYARYMDDGSYYRWGYSGDVALYGDALGGDIYAPNVSANHFYRLLQLDNGKNSDVAVGAYSVFAVSTARANSVLSQVGALPANEVAANQAKVNDLTGQMYAVRALSQFELTRLYCKLPVIAPDVNAANSGMPLFNQVFPANHKFSRATLKETYDQIIADFTKALTLLSKSRVTASGQMNYWSAAALLSRVYFYNGDYTNALKYAEEVINSGLYPLYTRDEYVAAWARTGTSESLFEVLTTDKISAQRNSLGYYTSPDGYAECAATDDFVAFAKARTGDVRADLVVEKAADGDEYKAYYTNKYAGQEGAKSPLYVNNYKVIRSSELYLIAAESILRGAASSKTAVSYYNDLRSNRISSYTPVSSVSLDDLLDERRIELFCEGHRMFDLMRYKRDITLPTTKKTYSYMDNQLQISIPQREIDIAQGKLVQNPE